MARQIDPPNTILYNYPFTATIGATEYSLVGGTTTSVPLTRTFFEIVRVRLDLNALAAGDEFQVTFYTKVNGGTQRVLAQYSLVGTYSQLWESDEFWMDADGWDVTIKKISGTDRSIRSTVMVQAAPYYLNGLVEVLPGGFIPGAGGPSGTVAPLIKKDEATAARRTVEFTIKDFDDYLVTGATLYGKISKNGGAAVATAGTFTEADSTDRPGVWKYEFDAGEVDTLGIVCVTPWIDDTNDTACGSFGAQVVAFDPYNAIPDVNVASMNDETVNAASVSSDVFNALGTIRYFGTCQAGGSTTTAKLDVSSSGTNDAYNGMIILLKEGAEWESRRVVDYDGTTKIATVYPALTFSPGASTEFHILASSGALEDNGLRDAGIAANAITSAKIAADAIGASQIATDAIGSSELAASAVTEIQTGLATSTALATAQSDLTTLTGRLTSSRAGYLDNLNVGGNVASSSEVTAIQNNTRAAITVPEVIERPDSGTTTYRIELYLYDEVGNMEAPDSAPTIALVNQAGTDRSTRLDSTTMALVSTGRYRAIYTADAADTLEQLVWTFSVTEGGATRVIGRQSIIVDTTAVDFTSADRTKLDTLAADYTTARAAKLDNLDATVSSRATDAGAADAVWDETIAGHNTAGTFGETVQSGSVDVGAIADAVWDEATSGHATAGTFGKAIADAPTNTVDTFMAFAHDTGVTMLGLSRRLESLVSGKATGLLGSLVRFFMKDGTTAAIEATQDVDLGTRQAADVSGSEP